MTRPIRPDTPLTQLDDHERRLVNLERRPGDAPTGAITAFWGTVAPSGWLVCDGSSFSATTYPALAALLGGTTLPNLKGRVLVGIDAAQPEFDALGETGGAKTHTLSTAEMPSHLHTADGAIVINTFPTARAWNIPAAAGFQELNGSAYVNPTGGDGAHNNLQPYMAINYIIKAN